MLSLLDHPNLVNLFRYENMELGSVEVHLLEPTTDQTLD
ncbi:hypothetical protein OROHE_010835 [Orobanche hederae]